MTAEEMVKAGDVSVLQRLRVVPASRAYFSGQPRFTDSLLELEAIQRKYETLPTIPQAQAPRVAWKDIVAFKTDVGANAEPVKVSKYSKIKHILKRLNRIHPALMPQEAADIMNRYKRDIQPHMNAATPGTIDIQGRAAGVGKRKSSSAVAYAVEGEGEVMVNGKPLSLMFSRVHDRETAIWALKATHRVDKYNIFAIVKGGGTTGQAGALTMAIAKALVVHEPALKTSLRAAGCITRDPRTVERKKAGKLKARKMPAWVKR
ncbi:hypothetical protein EJ05DRAFT_487104 [Pseudovirgaria hyperparasitica]|uniref:Small ribosomal subunit protein uS9m n=1 Tax=Pseudovirgaria hyperparasitica TaxID=470096 RepID=A0A6A6W508_9PEZI|nr:uncharacterized protein EJ05DRAFT_487104 [Pseudovirgaria hyperparasitica]KAF2757124.1 hypothetical protein EJ05DRAFT_487104 [Pseudovirgaria hyperparasitica]